MNAVCVERRSARGRFLFVCDHASPTIPDGLNDLGLDAAVKAEHIAWDIGALAVAQRLSVALDCPLVYPTMSRLVIDCNRAVDHPDLIVSSTEFGPVPGNVALGDDERHRRIVVIHQAFHDELAMVLQDRAARHLPTAVIAVHSFTPVLAGRVRPWHIGLLYNDDATLAQLLESKLKATRTITVGLNVPYSPHVESVNYTLRRHAEAAGLPCVMIELRNDLVREEAGQACWAERLLCALAGFGHDAEAQADNAGAAEPAETAGRARQ